MFQQEKKTCFKFNKKIHENELHKIVMYVIEEQITKHHYEHVECPEKFTV